MLAGWVQLYRGCHSSVAEHNHTVVYHVPDRVSHEFGSLVTDVPNRVSHEFGSLMRPTAEDRTHFVFISSFFSFLTMSNERYNE